MREEIRIRNCNGEENNLQLKLIEELGEEGYVQQLYEFFQGEFYPYNITADAKPNLTADQAQHVIYCLQEYFGILDDSGKVRINNGDGNNLQAELIKQLGEEEAYVQQLYEFLQGKFHPQNINNDNAPNLTADQAWNAIYCLQEYFYILDDRFERCRECGDIFDSESGGVLIDEDYTKNGFDDDDDEDEEEIEEEFKESEYGHYCDYCRPD